MIRRLICFVIGHDRLWLGVRDNSGIYALGWRCDRCGKES